MSFITADFILQNETAKKLYHTYAKDMPIMDYHCHLDPKEIFEDVRFENITQVWLAGDHYKWPRSTSQATLPTGRSSRSLPKLCPKPLATLCTIGATWS